MSENECHDGKFLVLLFWIDRLRCILSLSKFSDLLAYWEDLGSYKKFYANIEIYFLSLGVVPGVIVIA